MELEFGLSRSAIDHLVRSGELERIYRGIYRLAAIPPSYEQSLGAVCLRSHGTFASHRSAARLLGIGFTDTRIVEVTSTTQLRPAGGETVHRTKTMMPCDRCEIYGIPSTDVNRTLLDLGAVASKAEVEDALDNALISKRTSLARIEWRLTRVGTQGHPGTAVLRHLVADHGRNNVVTESVLEARFFSLLRRSRLPLPIAQHEIVLGSGRVFRADFAYPHASLAIELQGYRWHGGREAWRRDLSRSSDLAAAGWRIIYITWEDLRDRPAVSMNRIRAALFPNLGI